MGFADNWLCFEEEFLFPVDNYGVFDWEHFQLMNSSNINDDGNIRCATVDHPDLLPQSVAHPADNGDSKK